MEKRQLVIDAINHRQPAEVPVDFGSSTVCGVHASIVRDLRDYFGLEKRLVKMFEPYLGLGEIEPDLADALGIATAMAMPPVCAFGMPAADWKEWTAPWGQTVLVPGGFQTTVDENGDVFAYPMGDLAAPPSGKMPKSSFFFDGIVRQDEIDEDNLNPEDNLQEFTVLSDETVASLIANARKARATGRAVVFAVPGTALGDAGRLPGYALKHPKGIRAMDEWYMAMAAYPDYLRRLFEMQLEIGLANLEKVHKAAGDDLLDVIYLCGTDFGTQISTIAVEFTANQGNSIDVFMTRPMQEGRMMQRNGWYEDLAPYYKDDAEYDFADFSVGSVECTNIGGIQTGIPVLNETQLMYYRKDLLEAKGLKPPTTFEELEKAAAMLTDRSTDMSGFVARGQRAALITQFSSFLYSFGSDWFDAATNKSLVDTPDFLAAAKFYGGLLHKYGPQGALNMSWPQGVAIFGQGKAAIYIECSPVYPALCDPTKSAYSGVTGIAAVPAGPKARKVYTTTSWALAISANSRHKDAAWKFIRYVTSKDATILMQDEYANPCARDSVWLSEEGTKNFPPEMVKAISDSAPYGVGYDRPMVTAVSEARDVIGDVVVACIEGKDPEPVAKQAHAKFQELLDREKTEK